MLLNEIEISMTLDNPNIVKLYEIYEFNQAIYLVGEYPKIDLAFARVVNCSIDSINKEV